MAPAPTNRELLLMIEAAEKARELQATEYARRLADLNHEHARAKDVLNTYVPRELFDAYVKDQAARSEALALAVTLATGEKTGASVTTARMWTVTGVLLGATSIVSVLANYLTSH